MLWLSGELALAGPGGICLNNAVCCVSISRAGNENLKILQTGTSPISRQALRESILLLQRNLTPRGIVAASATPESAARNYTRVFSRDASISAMGMAVCGEPVLRQGAMAGLEYLAGHQAENGQIPNFVAPDTGETDFWYLGCIDATLWWLVAVGFWSRHFPEDCVEERFRGRIDAALRWLLCQEHQKIRLLQQNEASDWADIMPRSGFVLYTNALWYHVKRVYSVAGAEETRRSFNALFSPSATELPEYRRMRLLTHYVRNGGKRGDLYLSYVNFSTWGEEGDVFGNLLAVLFGLADEKRANRIVDRLLAAGVDAPNPVRAVCDPIGPSSPQWRAYMGRHRQNAEYQYHNGGAWPFLGGFWVMALASLGRGPEAAGALSRVARMNSVGGWAFREWFHGRTGEPCGMAGQSWNAAAYLLAERSLEHPPFRGPDVAPPSPEGPRVA